ncbi:5-oxoprolinase isoform X2 [Oratosquilla oratoria]
MQSDGGLTQMDSFIGSRAILSGPAGGVVGYAMTTYKQFNKEPVIGFDMGGTSTDVSRFAGTYEHVFESTTAGVSIQAPQLDVNTVAAGGGSRLFFRSGMFVVGPDSAGAHPGPVCYRKNGYLAVTDANLALGRLLPQYFPKIFGPNEDEPLDKEGTLRAFQELTDEINTFREGADIMSLEEVAMGFVEVANEAMCRPIRALTQAKGHDTSQHILSVFGGAGAQHACAIARALGMHKVFVHKYAGILSAFGMALADVVHEVQEPCARRYETKNYPYIEERITALKEKCIETLQSKGFKRIEYELYLHMRYKGTDCALMCTALESTSQDHGKKFAYGDFKGAFLERYKNEFGFIIDDRPIIIDDIRVRGIGKSSVDVTEGCRPASGDPPVELETLVYFHGGYQSTKVYKLSNLCAGHIIPGPAIIKDQLSTILIEPDCHATITKQGDISIDVGSGPKFKVGKELDAIQLSIFSHRFMSLAEQMGRILQRTSISTNIKERLDFSCALFGPDGGLVSNAPHIPVHLGAMQEAVQYQRKVLGHKLQEGDVLLSNHPTAGGSHLPDLTVITPVFRKGRSADGPIFYVASRGHHADIGGITPGSMPPHSTSIHQEGAVFKSFKLVDRGVFKEEALIDALMAPGKIPGSSGTRNLHDNLSDLRAQVAANQKGIVLVNELIDYYGLDVVQAYMNHIQESAEMAVKDLLKVVSKRTLGEDGLVNLKAKEFMDDGSEICLNVCINSEEGTAVFDFSGTSHEVWGNCNAPRAITMSAIIYCLRCMVGYDVPLNQGCLNPIEIKIPPGSILAPSDEAAVVGGNVQTSQRVVDVILKAFKACAASQGCMNNVTFGDKDVGYYETVAGGAGAGPTWHGRSGIHSHMTNTRITDPEILEKRYPVVLQKFTLRRGTGGSGKYRGGDGVIRQLMFRRLLTMSILTERRVFAPYGMEGGECGAKGENYLVRRNGRIIRLPSKTSVDVEKGDVFLLHTPGGGGYGMVHDAPYELCIESPNKRQKHIERGSVYDFNKAQESV